MSSGVANIPFIAGRRSILAFASTPVDRHPRLYSGNVPAARFLVRSSFRAGAHDLTCEADTAGGTHAARGTGRLCSLYGAGEISTDPLYLVAATESKRHILAWSRLPIRFWAHVGYPATSQLFLWIRFHVLVHRLVRMQVVINGSKFLLHLIVSLIFLQLVLGFCSASRLPIDRTQAEVSGRAGRVEVEGMF